MNAPANMQLVLSLAKTPGTSGYKMHNAGYKALGLNYLYLPRRYEGDIAKALEALRTLGIRGASLTMPFKQSCLPYLDALSPEAAAIGAVNTVVNDGGKLTGYNTDAPAAKKLIEAYLPYKDKPWVILGAGGMAHAFAYVAKALGADAYICARSQENAEKLAQRFALKTLAWDTTLGDAIICNATPIGMASHSEAKLQVSSLAGVFDAVVNPVDTALVSTAKAHALPVVTGDMLALEQACLQFALYTGVAAPRDVMHEAMHVHTA
jgi:shikimate dehydrogenase